MRLLLPCLALACSAQPAPPTMPAAPAGPPQLALTEPLLVTGQDATLRASTVPAGTRVWFALSSTLLGPAACPPALAPTCLDLAAPVQLLGNGLAGPDGVASVTVTVPVVPPGDTVWLQALVAAGGLVTTSNVAMVPILDAAGDADSDGIDNATEAGAGLDPFSADSDGDGLSDAAETSTDPTSPDSDGDGLSDGLSALDDRLDGLTSDLAAALALIDDLQGTVAALQADLAAVDARLPSDGLASPGLITGDVVIEVPTDVPTIEAALAWLDDKHIAPSGSVTVSLLDGTYALADTLRIDHPDGARLFLVGNPADPAAVTLTAPPDQVGVLVTDGHALGGLDGLTLVGSGTAPVDGVAVQYSSMARLGPDLVVTGFRGSGIAARFTSSAVATGTTSTANQGGFLATRNAALDMVGAVASNNTRDGILVDWSSTLFAANGASVDNGRHGVVASAGGSASLGRMTVTGNAELGLLVERNAHAFARNAVVDGNGVGLVGQLSGTVDALGITLSASLGDGAQCRDNGFLELPNATATGNGGYGVSASGLGLVDAAGASLAGNALGDAFPALGLEPDGEVW